MTEFALTLACPLCGARIGDTEACRRGCPVAHNCVMVRCPNCSYELPDPRHSWFARLLMRRWGKVACPPGAASS